MGTVKVKLGPLSLTYKGTAKFSEKDQESHTITIGASGKLKPPTSARVAQGVQARRRPDPERRLSLRSRISTGPS